LNEKANRNKLFLVSNLDRSSVLDHWLRREFNGHPPTSPSTGLFKLSRPNDGGSPSRSARLLHLNPTAVGSGNDGLVRDRQDRLQYVRNQSECSPDALFGLSRQPDSSQSDSGAERSESGRGTAIRAASSGGDKMSATPTATAASTFWTNLKQWLPAIELAGNVALLASGLGAVYEPLVAGLEAATNPLIQA